jgi:general stress protein YciG
MDPEKLREISSKGGYAVHAAGKAYEFSRGEEAAEAGRRGGLTTSSDPEHMAEIGRKGANAKHRKGRFFGLLGT